MAPIATIERMIYNYPSLFPSRADALVFLFSVIGNGYEWVNGELVNVFPEPDKTDEEVQYLPNPYTERGADDPLRKIDPEFVEREEHAWDMDNLRRLETRRAAATRAVDASEPRSSMLVYQESKYAALRNLPEDITPAWKATAEEARKIIEPLWPEGER